MNESMMEQLKYTRRSDFPQQLSDWIGDVFYDFLPEHGYEIREEQIYTAFQIAEAMSHEKVHFAEAALGTGKTIAYLMSAIPYARLMKKPVVICCATPALQEQLASAEGDIKKLSKLVFPDVDARMAKDPREYLCDAKIEENNSSLHILTEEERAWLKTSKRGERSEMPTITDAKFRLVGYDESRDCDSCMNRGYCKLVQARKHYRDTKDLLIVDHATFFHDLWTRKERKAQGMLTILPEYSGVVFDEGHKILLPAAMEAGVYITSEELLFMTDALQDVQGVREAIVSSAYAVEVAQQKFFSFVESSLVEVKGMERLKVKISKELFVLASQLKKELDRLLVELSIEQGLYFDLIPKGQMEAYEVWLERSSLALKYLLSIQDGTHIVWMDPNDEKLWVVPKNTGTMIKKELFDRNLPVIFTSATLSNDGDFSYLANQVKASSYTKSTVPSPYDLEECVSIMTYENSTKTKTERLITQLKNNKGHALVLLNSEESLETLKEELEGVTFEFPILWEDMAERGHLIREFKEKENSVLIGRNFWEGIDIPGEALTMVIVYDLPFPALDPLLEAMKEDCIAQGKNPDEEVIYPEMGLKLKQGCGRLIRSESDHGTIVILDEWESKPYEAFVKKALPEDAKITAIK